MIACESAIADTISTLGVLAYCAFIGWLVLK